MRTKDQPTNSSSLHQSKKFQEFCMRHLLEKNYDELSLKIQSEDTLNSEDFYNLLILCATLYHSVREINSFLEKSESGADTFFPLILKIFRHHLNCNELLFIIDRINTNVNILLRLENGKSGLFPFNDDGAVSYVITTAFVALTHIKKALPLCSSSKNPENHPTIVNAYNNFLNKYSNESFATHIDEDSEVYKNLFKLIQEVCNKEVPNNIDFILESQIPQELSQQELPRKKSVSGTMSKNAAAALALSIVVGLALSVIILGACLISTPIIVGIIGIIATILSGICAVISGWNAKKYNQKIDNEASLKLFSQKEKQKTSSPQLSPRQAY